MKLLTTGLVGLAPRRKYAGYTQQTFAQALGIERSALANYEVGISWPSASLLPKMADLLCCTIDELYERPEAEAEEPAASIDQDGGVRPCRRTAGTSTKTPGGLPG